MGRRVIMIEELKANDLATPSLIIRPIEKRNRFINNRKLLDIEKEIVREATLCAKHHLTFSADHKHKY